jgi:hypothetical protein
MTLTDRCVREAIAISTTIAYGAIFHRGELRTLLVRPWGGDGPGIWVRRVVPGPKYSAPRSEANP